MSLIVLLALLSSLVVVVRVGMMLFGLNFPEPRQQVLEGTIFLYLLRCTVVVYRYVSLILISLRSKPVPVAA